MRRRIATATSFSRPARAAITNTPPPAAVTARCASWPNSRRSDDISPSSSACAAASISGSSRSTAASSWSARRLPSSMVRMRSCSAASPSGVAVLAQPLRQGQLQQIAAGMRRQPGLQIGVDAVHQPHPGAAMHVAAFLGRHHVAGHFRLHAVARQQQVERRAVLEAGEAHGEAALALHRGGAQQVEHRHQRAAVRQPRAQRRAQPLAPGARQAAMGAHRLGRHRRHVPLRRAGRPDGAPAQPLDGHLDGVALQRRLALPLALRHRRARSPPAGRATARAPTRSTKASREGSGSGSVAAVMPSSIGCVVSREGA